MSLSSPICPPALVVFCKLNRPVAVALVSRALNRSPSLVWCPDLSHRCLLFQVENVDRTPAFLFICCRVRVSTVHFTIAVVTRLIHSPCISAQLFWAQVLLGPMACLGVDHFQVFLRRAFPTKSQLTLSMQTHTAETPHACTECGPGICAQGWSGSSHANPHGPDAVRLYRL